VFFAALILIASAGMLHHLMAQKPADFSVLTNGDINNDGIFDVFDILYLEKAVLLNLPLNPEIIQTCDVDGDGRLTNFDLLVMHNALNNVGRGMEMFDAIKSSIEADLAKSGDNVEIYLDLARFYRKEQLYSRSISVLESIAEALDTSHPLYQTITKTLGDTKDEDASRRMAEENPLNQELYNTSSDQTGKVGLRRKVVQLQSRLSTLLKDANFAAHYNSKRVKSRLNSVMENMLQKIDKDPLIAPGDFDNFGGNVRKVLEDQENLVKELNDEQRQKISSVVEQATTAMKEEAVKLNQSLAAGEKKGKGAGGEGDLSKSAFLDRSNWRLKSTDQEGQIDRLIIANKPVFKPDTISIVAPAYSMEWDVSNVLGAKDATLEISKANQKFANPRGTALDEKNTLYYTPSLNGVTGQRKGSALELEGVGIYQYRIAALNAKGELISRFSDAVELVVVYNNVNIIARKPQIDPKQVSLKKPSYNFRWDVSNIEGAKDAAVEISKPNADFTNPNGRERDRLNTFFLNPSLGKVSGTFSSSVEGLAGAGTYLFRVIGVSPVGDFIGQWSDPDTMTVTEEEGPESAQQTPIAAAQIIPDPPQIDTTASTLTFIYDLSRISGAKGINLALSKNSADSVAMKLSGGVPTWEPVLNQIKEEIRGVWAVDSTQLPGPGQYRLRVSAVDSAGKILGSWSRPRMFTVRGSGIISPGNVGQKMPAAAVSQAAKSPDTAQAKIVVQPKPVPEGNKLEVVSNNTPLYESNDPSSKEMLSLKKGEVLIQVGENGLWFNVYYPVTGANGWVLTFNVKNLK